jgi:hypothetical protein
MLLFCRDLLPPTPGYLEDGAAGFCKILIPINKTT